MDAQDNNGSNKNLNLENIFRYYLSIVLIHVLVWYCC